MEGIKMTFHRIAPTSSICNSTTESSTGARASAYWLIALLFAFIGTITTVSSAQTGYSNSVGYSTAQLGVPQYTCVRNWYLDPNGSDSNSGNSPSSAWATLGKADANVMPGDCVNLASGVYGVSAYVMLTHGGNANTSTGYVVYRSSTPRGAIIRAIAQQGPDIDLVYASASYLIFDGLVFDGNNNYVPAGCVASWGAYVHHWVFENNVATGCGSFGLSGSDYSWFINNETYGNSGTDTYNEGSGIDIYEITDATDKTKGDPNFVPNANDLALQYRIVIAYNISHDNYVYPSGCLYNVVTGCGSGDGNKPGDQHTDGNGIILDDWDHTQSDNNPYTGSALVIGNIVYNNGGAGIQVYETSNATVVNNSAYNNHTDDQIFGGHRGEISCDPCYNSQFINNATYAVIGPDWLAFNAPYAFNPGSINVTWTNNIGYPSAMQVGSLPAGNQVGTDPEFKNPAAGDFSLLNGSPAAGSGSTLPWLQATNPNLGKAQPLPSGVWTRESILGQLLMASS